MKLRKKSKDGSIYVTDEKFNTASHIIGLILSLFGVVVLIVESSIKAKVWHIVSFSIYGTTLILLFLASSLHHGIFARKKIENIFRQFDYIAIFPLIAGTFTPFCLILLRNPFGWSIFGVVWAIAIIGIIIKGVFPAIPKWLTHTLYIGMGWLGIFIAIPLLKIIGFIGVGLITLGGILYTIGALIYYFEKPNPIPGKFGFHEIWHIFVILGCACFYFDFYFFVLPY
ncbi:MAG TPA: hemolysin III family protein [Spirochaetota bacterium]|nr:hemolysin III family protein [Spirochaetota bacterium]HOL58124.1 hemolysin III family protein [Spirochaetota bacterium]HPP05601.1 hemolysin III family protein [Spirochaetota bacterium]